MKKTIAIIMSLCLLSGLLIGCGQSTPKAEKLSIVTTIFPIYDWTREILGEEIENVELTMLLDNGVDLHSYQPTAEDMIMLSGCDMLIYVGGESDHWVDEALENATNPDMVVVNLLEVLGDEAVTEELVEGMEATDHHHEGHKDHENHNHQEHEDAEVEEHVWLSLQNAQLFVAEIQSKLELLDGEKQAVYTANGAAYGEELSALDDQYENMVANATCHTLLFGARFPFRYLTEDYDLDYYAAFVGCSAETEASFETIAFLANKVEELGLPGVLTLEDSDHKIAQTVIDATESKNKKVLTLDSMQSVTAKEVEQGATYYAIMADNLEVLTTALS